MCNTPQCRMTGPGDRVYDRRRGSSGEQLDRISLLTTTGGLDGRPGMHVANRVSGEVVLGSFGLWLDERALHQSNKHDSTT